MLRAPVTSRTVLERFKLLQPVLRIRSDSRQQSAEGKRRKMDLVCRPCFWTLFFFCENKVWA